MFILGDFGIGATKILGSNFERAVVIADQNLSTNGVITSLQSTFKAGVVLRKFYGVEISFSLSALKSRHNLNIR